MKTLLICLGLSVFAMSSSLQAGEQNAKIKVETADQGKSSCCESTTSCSAAAKKEVSSCCSAPKVAKKTHANVKGAVILAGR